MNRRARPGNRLEHAHDEENEEAPSHASASIMFAEAWVWWFGSSLPLVIPAYVAVASVTSSLEAANIFSWREKET